MYQKRISIEINKLTADKEADVGIYKVFDDKKTFYAFIRGPSDSPFEGGYFKIFVHLKDDYPFSPPYMKFMTKIYHPNISSQTGAICLDILKDKWTAAMSITTALLSVEALLTAAVPEDPQDYPVAVVYTENRDEYNKEAKKWTKEYATEAVTPNEELIERLLKKYDLKTVMKRLSMNIWDEKRLEKLLGDKEGGH